MVKTGDKLPVGIGKDLVFIEAPMHHWPDSMFSYLTGDAILFSNDAFGQHYASEHMFNDLVDQDELWEECVKYYANILTPFNALVKAKIEQVVGLGLPVNMIATSHGIIWRKDPLQIVNKYMEWAQNYKEDRITIVYDSMWGATRRIAEEIGKGVIEASPGTDVRLYNVAIRDKNDAITDVFKSRAIAVGSPTVNKGILSGIAGVLEEIKGLQFKGKKAVSFGSYGWSGEGNKVLNAILKDSGFELVDDGFKAVYRPDEDILAQARAYGAKLAKA
ncbi:MAG: flavodoxin domain-containing protein [Spirochaetia bacterium]|nr:flavodoxin domain-containing protein [Spirochaetia bacterium]